jgi:hypothetical protein
MDTPLFSQSEMQIIPDTPVIYTAMDHSVNFFFSSIGGLNFLGLAFGFLIIIAIIISFIRPFDL